MVGVWLIDESFPLLTNDDPIDLRNRIALKDLVLFETTLATNNQPIKFTQAIEEANRKIAEQSEDEFVYVLDVKQARSRKIDPINFGTENQFIQAEGTKKTEVELPPLPVLPSITSQDLSSEDILPSDRIDQWRRKLLDLSSTNKLLNINQRSMGFQVLCPDLGILEDDLANGKKFNLVSKENGPLSAGRSASSFTMLTGDDLENEFVRDQLKRGNLIANCTEKELEKDLINLFRKAKSNMEEGGANTLFLAIGMLRWKKDPRSDQSYRAPLILLPVRLERTSARAKPRLMQLPDEGPVFNLTLIELLHQDFEIDLSIFQSDLPKDASGIDVNGIWNTVRAKIKDTQGFEVVEELVLSNFSFAKYLMWKDLSDRIDDLKTSPFIDHLIEKPTDPYPHTANFIDANDIDDKIAPQNLFTPLNADSAQILAIEASAKGTDFILEGPPGTGKSETIANIIAHNIAIGRKVLFVSEKMAALEVVYTRLKKAGLGHLCLELHSNKATKKSVIDQLDQAWQVRESAKQEDWIEKANDLGLLRRHLNQYVKHLHEKSKLGYSAWDAIAIATRNGGTSGISLEWPCDLSTAPIQTKTDVDRVKKLAKDLALAFSDVEGIDFKAFSLISASDWSYQWQTNITNKAKTLNHHLDLFNKSITDFFNSLNTPKPENLNLEACICWIDIAKTCIASVNQSYDIALSEESNVLIENLDHLAQLKEKFDKVAETVGLNVEAVVISSLPIKDWLLERKKCTTIQDQYHFDLLISKKLEAKGLPITTTLQTDTREEIASINLKIKATKETIQCHQPNEVIVELPVSSWIKQRDNAESKNIVTKFFTHKTINKLMRQKGLKPGKDLGIIDSYKRLIDNIVTLNHIRTHQALRFYSALSDLISQIDHIISSYNGKINIDCWNSTPQQILEFKKHVLSVQRNFRSAARQLQDPNVFTQTAREHMVTNRDLLESSPILIHSKNLIQAYEESVASLNAFEQLAGKTELSAVELPILQNTLSQIIDSAKNLNAWCHWIDAKNKADNAGLHALSRALEDNLITPDKIQVQLESAICLWLAPLLIDASSILCTFSASKHDDLIANFRRLDEEVAVTTGRYIAAKLAAGMPDTTGPEAPHEYGVLSRELQRQRGHKPTRQLIQELGEYLLCLTPCFMMSPLSVAQYLPADYKAFDLVVFDEASQITVWDAVGAIARGKNVIVVGDPKQMPPTSFFNRSQETDDSDEADLESILDQAMAARMAYHRLTGHYRSKHESLITFSNHQYYHNTLTTFPCADTRDSAVTWHRVNGIYSKGASRNNPIEAQAVVKEVTRRLNDPELQKQSIGVVTLNTEQQRLILDLLEDECRKDASLERFFNESSKEPVFVKNLETVQGDQRDVICLSVGYGPTEPGAQTMSMNFGPINRQGGERRLNVAITRASNEMLVFTSFDPSMIDLSRTSSQAVKDLKAYIDFAARGPIALAQQTELIGHTDQFDSAFEQAIATQLRQKGWQLKTQIGVSKFRIDLGVLNPDVGGSFLAGIECDGATYHSSPSARDRDRVRHIILENLGWKLVRIWSTDYFINPSKVIDRVHNELTELLQEDREKRQRKLDEQARHNSENCDDDQHPEDDVPEEEDQFLHLEPRETPLQTNTEPSKEYIQPVPFCSAANPTSTPHVIEKYNEYNGDPTNDPRTSDVESIAEGLIKIVEFEGPILAKRAYDIYLRHSGIKRMGKDLKKLMNRALQHTIKSGTIRSVDEWESGGLLYTIIHIPGQKMPNLRELGGRTVDEIPPSEINEASQFVLKQHQVEFGCSEHIRLILNVFGLKRLTAHTQEKLLQAISKGMN
jgi:very-short-patch-repair endonuclease